jgi:alpha-galactosidase/6-phospho-beta-glucosidase family protein
MAAEPGGGAPSLRARPTPWFDEALVPMLAAIVEGTPWRGFANVRNGDLVPELVPEVVVEVRAALVDRRMRPEPDREPMPPAVRSFVRRTAVAEDAIYRSWRDADEELLVDALVVGPHQLEPPRARRLADAIRSGARLPVGASR